MLPHDATAPEPPKGVCSQGGTTGRMVYRAMREDPSGGPQVGPTARTLGVRSGVDIPVTAGQVRPNGGGMSVAPDRPENLHPLRRPPACGGFGRDPVWCLDLARLSGDLRFRQDSPTHGLIEPARAMSLDQLQEALAKTAPSWQRLP